MKMKKYARFYYEKSLKSFILKLDFCIGENMEKPKIGLFIDTFFPMVDGVVNVLDNHAKILSKWFDVTVFTVSPTKNKQDETEHPYRVVRCKSAPIFFLDYDLPMPSLDKNFNKILKESNLDLVYFHSPMYVSKKGVRYAKKHNIPIICHLHSQFKRDFYRATHSKILTKMLLNSIMNTFNQSDVAVAVNEFTRDLFINEYKLKVPTKIIYNATDMTPVENIEQAKTIVNEKYGLDPNEKIFLFVGRVNKLKNIDIALDALALLKKKFQKFKFLIVGSGGDLNYFKNRVEKLNLRSNVMFIGKVMDRELLKDLYARSDLFLFPSEYDTDGLVKFEAASQHTPTIFIENTGAASSIVDNETGFIVANDPQKFAEKIFNIVTDDSLYQHVSQNVFDGLYRTWEDSAKEVRDLIFELLNKKRSEK